MLIYVIVSVSIITLGLYFELINSQASTELQKKKIPSYFFIVPSFIILFIVSAFRGDFTTDYNNYLNLFNLYNNIDFSNIFKAEFNQEIGYIILSRLIGVYTENEIYLFIITSFIILYAHFFQFNKYSSYIWLSILMFVTIGSFYTSFNITRQILAVSIIFLGSRFLYERKPLKYFFVVIIATLFHTTSLIMIVFYFILNLKFSFKNLFFMFSGAIIAMVFLKDLIVFFQNIVYSNYTESSYGMTGLSFSSTIIPIALLTFSLFHYHKVDLSNTKHRIWMNSVIFYAFFTILTLQVQLIERISEFFSPYVMLLIPLILSNIKNGKMKVVYMVGLIFMLFLYNYIYLSGSGYDPYYFFWD